MLGIDAHSLAEHTKPCERQGATTRHHIVAVDPHLTLVICRSWESAVLLLIMSSNLNCAGPTEEDVVEIQTEEQCSIKVNNMLFLTHYPKLTKVALQVLVMHPTSASTERNWSLWGRVYIASRNALAITRAGKVILLQFTCTER
jgi:hypothetical protein